MNRQPGRLKKPDPVAKRPQFNARVRPALRDQLERAAQENRRSISEEAESRMERSFLLDQVLGGQYPLLMAATFTLAGQQAGAFKGITGEEWQADPECYSAALLATVKELWLRHPDVVDCGWKEWCQRLVEFLGGRFGPDNITQGDLRIVGGRSGDFEAGRRAREEAA